MSVRQELLALVDDDGLLKPPTVHDWAASHPKSDLHGRLEWDDKVAGYQYRLTQIRSIIQITVKTVDHKPQMISLSIDRSDPGGGYRNIGVVMHDRDLRKVALFDALNELDRIHARFGDLTELDPIWQQIHRVRREVLEVAPTKRGRLSEARLSKAERSVAQRSKAGKAGMAKHSQV